MQVCLRVGDLAAKRIIELLEMIQAVKNENLNDGIAI
jgi:hypothetical protein